MNLVGGRVLITGATGGLGGAIARAFAVRGAQLTLTGRRTDVLEPLAAELGARALACDLADRASVDALIADAGEIDVLVANAAMPATRHALELTREQLDRMLEVNLRAPLELARAVAPAMASRGAGHIVFISSLNGKAATPRTAPYCAAKFGLRGFALAIRDDLRDSGVGVSLVYPGFVRGAGMFVDSNVRLPFYIRTNTPEEIGEGVIRAVERNRAEVTVAPLMLRASTAFASLAPQLASTISHLLGSDKLAIEFASGQADKIARDFQQPRG